MIGSRIKGMLSATNKVKSNPILNIALILIIIYNSGYVLATSRQNYAAYILILGLLILLPRILKTNFMVVEIDLHFFFFILHIISIMCTMIANFDFDVSSINTYIRMLLLITFSFLFTFYFEFEYFADIFTKLMAFITLISIFFYFATNIFGLRFDTSIFTNVNGTEYNNYYYIFFSMTRFPERVIGIFWEPGLYSSFIIFAIIIEIVYKKNTNYKKVVLFFIGILIAQSTSAMFLLLPLLILIISDRIKGKYKVLLMFTLPVLFLMLYIYGDYLIEQLYYWKPSLFEKVYSSTRTTTTRLYSPLLNFQIFLSRPIFGIGFKNANVYYSELMAYQNDVIGAQTSTSLYMMASLGIFGLSYTLFPLIGISRNKSLDALKRICVAIIMILIINKEPHNQLAFTWCLMFYFLKYSKKPMRIQESVNRQGRRLKQINSCLNKNFEKDKNYNI